MQGSAKDPDLFLMSRETLAGFFLPAGGYSPELEGGSVSHKRLVFTSRGGELWTLSTLVLSVHGHL